MTTTEDPGPHPSVWDWFSMQSFAIALGLALDGEQAPERCRRRACKLAGVCCVKLAAGRPPSCGGGPIADRALEDASFGALVATQVAIAAGLLPKG